MKYLCLMLACLLTGCGSIVTVAAFGFSATFQFPPADKIKPEISANVTTMPATQPPTTMGVKP